MTVNSLLTKDPSDPLDDCSEGKKGIKAGSLIISKTTLQIDSNCVFSFEPGYSISINKPNGYILLAAGSMVRKTAVNFDCYGLRYGGFCWRAHYPTVVPNPMGAAPSCNAVCAVKPYPSAPVGSCVNAVWPEDAGCTVCQSLYAPDQPVCKSASSGSYKPYYYRNPIGFGSTGFTSAACVANPTCWRECYPRVSENGTCATPATNWYTNRYCACTN